MTLGGAELCGVHLVPYTDAKIFLDGDLNAAPTYTEVHNMF